MHHMKGWLHGLGHGAAHTHDQEPGEPGENGPDRDRGPGLHPVNVTHLVMGVAFLGIVGVWAILTSGALLLSEAEWLIPVPFLVAGALGLAASVAAGARRRRTHP